MTSTGEIIEPIPMPHNPNRHTERGDWMTRESLRTFGGARSVVVAVNPETGAYETVAGNGVIEAAHELGIPVVPVHTRGDALIAVVRDDWDGADDPRARSYAVADNRTSEVGLDWSEDVLTLFVEQDVALDTWFFQSELDAILGTEPDTENPEENPPQENDPELLRIEVYPNDALRFADVMGRLREEGDTLADTFAKMLDLVEGAL